MHLCRGTRPCFADAKGSGGAWEGWVMKLNLEREKESHFFFFKCQPSHLVASGISHSLDRYSVICDCRGPIHNIQVGFNTAPELRKGVAFVHRFDRMEHVSAEREIVCLLVFLLDYKGWLNLVHFNEQQLFACIHPRSVESFLCRAPSQMKEKKAPLKWRARTRWIR